MLFFKSIQDNKGITVYYEILEFKKKNNIPLLNLIALTTYAYTPWCSINDW